MRANVLYAKYFKPIITYKRAFYMFDENVKSWNIWLGNTHGMAPNSAYDFQCRRTFNSISRCFFTHAVNQVREVKRGGPLMEYERRIAAGRLENGDASQVPDIAVAFILSRLFEHLFCNGVILVTTSNRAPENLYQGGLQRDLFLSFVATLKDRCLVHKIVSPIDYRKRSLTGETRYFVVNNLSASLLKQKFQLLIGENVAGRLEIDVVMGRKLKVPLGSNGCAYFSFEELCDRPYGAADYSALFNKFHSLALEGVPIFGVHNRPAAYRFVTMVDVMYDNKAILLCTAEGNPVELFQRIVTISQAHSHNTDSFSDLCVDNKLAFAKDRTISRLTEMNSKKYFDQHAAMLTAKGNTMELDKLL